MINANFIHINNRSDFQLLLKNKNGGAFPTFDFTLVFQTLGGFRYYVKSTDAVRFVPNEDRTQAVITFDFADGNYFPNGRLSYTIKADVPNAMFPDGFENVQTPRLLDIMVWDGASDDAGAIEVDFIPPLPKGDKGDKGDKGIITTTVLDTSNVIRKRVPYKAMAYQLYYTDMVRVPNALAKQKKFDDKVPQWFSEFLKRLAKTTESYSIPVFVSQIASLQNNIPSCPSFCIGEILVHYDEEGHAYYDTTITPIKDAQVPEHYYYDTMFFQVPYGVYYFDDNRALHRYCDKANYRPVERVLPTEVIQPSYSISSSGILCLHIGYNYEHECYVRRRKHSPKSAGVKKTKRWYFYWRKTGLLRSLNNSPIDSEYSNVAYVRVRRRSSQSEFRTNRWWSKWQYFNVSVGDGNWTVTPARER